MKKLSLKTILEEKPINDPSKQTLFNGKSGDEWRNILRGIPYDNLIEWAELSQKPKFADLLLYMKKKIKYL